MVAFMLAYRRTVSRSRFASQALLQICALVASVNLGINAMQGWKMSGVEMELERFSPGVINAEEATL